MLLKFGTHNNNRFTKTTLLCWGIVTIGLGLVLSFIYFRYWAAKEKIYTKLCGDKDTSLYEEIKLANGMRVVVVSNPDTTKAAAALSVGAGFANDPTEHPGLAHLLEHMLFMGSDKYPEEDYYSNFIVGNSGVRNAYTTLFETKYFHALPAEHGREALSILSRFFIDPRISENTLEREKKAVDSEMKMNRSSSISRRLLLVLNLIKKTHPMSKFPIGSEETLANATRADLMSFWKYHYTPKNMTLVIFGKESLKELKGYAKEFFGDVKEHKDAKWEFSGKPTHIEPTTKRDHSDKSYELTTKETSNKIVYYRPYKDEESNTQLVIYVFLPALQFVYREHTLSFLIKMMEDSNDGSLSSILLKNNITSSASVGSDMEKDSTHFEFHCTLLHATPEKIASVLNLIEAYLKLIKENASEKLYQKYAKLMQKQKQNLAPVSQLKTATQTATSLAYRKLEDVFTGDYDWTGFNKEDFDYILSIMTDRSNWLVMVETNNLFPNKPLLSTPHFDVKYFIEEVSKVTDLDIDALQSKLAWTAKDLAEEVDFSTARGKNVSYSLGSTFKNIKECDIPADKEIEHFSITEDGFEAHLIHKRDIHSKDARITIYLGSDDIYKNISTFVSFTGYTRAFPNNFFLAHNEEMQMSGVSLEPIIERFGAVSMTFTGNPLVLEDLIRIFFKEFNERKEELLTQTINAAITKHNGLKQSIPAEKLAPGLFRSKNYYKYLDDEACIKAAHNLTIKDFFSITEADIKLYAIGNLTQSEFARICQVVKANVTPNAQKKFVLPQPSLTHVDVAVHDQENIALLVSHEVTKFGSVKNLIIADLICRFTANKFADKLRTKKSYGYIVQTGSIPLFAQSHLIWVVQTTYPYETVKTEILEFIATIASLIRDLSSTDFEGTKQSLIASYQHKVGNQQEYLTQRLNFWRFHGFDINHFDKLAELTAAVTQEELVDYCATELSKNITTVLASSQVTTS
ncbi:insulysin [Nematocida homosporus]|uniref:insulysin n=1 Tax=Nematocida homosporus TaxID=1912981 RepID=UPI00221EA996|nr:insulysin [Nematocida homosporus]KAI5184624.1 insulysin [Nematocida homosporus]